MHGSAGTYRNRPVPVLAAAKVTAVPDGLCLLSVHAHPDDESSKGASTVARYHAEGVRTVLVCCTGGEEGDILNPAMDRPEIRADLAVWTEDQDGNRLAPGEATVIIGSPAGQEQDAGTAP